MAEIDSNSNASGILKALAEAAEIDSNSNASVILKAVAEADLSDSEMRGLTVIFKRMMKGEDLSDLVKSLAPQQKAGEITREEAIWTVATAMEGMQA